MLRKNEPRTTMTYVTSFRRHRRCGRFVTGRYRWRLSPRLLLQLLLMLPLHWVARLFEKPLCYLFLNYGYVRNRTLTILIVLRCISEYPFQMLVIWLFDMYVWESRFSDLNVYLKHLTFLLSVWITKSEYVWKLDIRNRRHVAVSV